jgi:hypothetical protein
MKFNAQSGKAFLILLASREALRQRQKIHFRSHAPLQPVCFHRPRLNRNQPALKREETTTRP